MSEIAEPESECLCWRLIKCKKDRHEHYCLSVIFILVIINGLAWGFLDSFVYSDQYGDYQVVVVISFFFVFIWFSFGYFAYLKRLPTAILIFDIVLLILIIAGIGYGFYFLFIIWYWGIIIFFVDYLLGWVLYGTWMVYRDIKRQPESNHIALSSI